MARLPCRQTNKLTNTYLQLPEGYDRAGSRSPADEGCQVHRAHAHRVRRRRRVVHVVRVVAHRGPAGREPHEGVERRHSLGELGGADPLRHLYVYFLVPVGLRERAGGAGMDLTGGGEQSFCMYRKNVHANEKWHDCLWLL